ncbi:MAG: site-specific integrase [Campylobacter sp.]|nr:site-specific integrase [Campylobacter sp.]
MTDEQTLKSFLQDLKKDIKMQFQTKNALMLHILSANRPINTASAKWEYIDFENGVWRIPADDMKMDKAHEIALSEQMIKILKNQYKYTCNSIYVFPANNQNGHLNKDTLGNVIRNIGAKNKYNVIASVHGFRATFKTICSQHEAELMQMGIGEKIVEECLAHKENNKVKYAYERNRATLEKKRALMQWYADFLNSIENIF